MADEACETRPRLGGQVQRVAVAGGTLAVESIGAGPAVLLLHGWTLDRRMWALQVPLAAHFRLVALDRRGFGQSDAPPEVMAEPEDVLRVADALGLEHFHLLGMSQGGKVALHAAARAGTRLQSLVLQGAALEGVVTAGTAPGEAIPMKAMHAAVMADDLPAMKAMWTTHPLVQAHGGDTAARLASMLADYDGRDLRVRQEALTGDLALLDALEAPMLAMTGAHDTPLRRATVAGLAARGMSRGAKAAIIEGAGHLANLDRPHEYNRIVEIWWRDNS